MAKDPEKEGPAKLSPLSAIDIECIAEAVVAKLSASTQAGPTPGAPFPASAVGIARDLITMPKHPESVNEKIHELAAALTAEGLL